MQPDPREELSADVCARVGLFGNPSDGYGGRVIAFTVGQLLATVSLKLEQGGIVLIGADGAADRYPDRSAVATAVTGGGLAGGAQLLGAAVVQAPLVPAGFRLSFDSAIPREVGLSGSSAIVIGGLRVLADAVGHRPSPVATARRAWQAEVETLGITAGPQDRIVQAFGGLLDMDFARPWDPASYQRLDPQRLPPCFVAWDESSAESSGAVHADVRARWDAGDREARETIAAFVGIAQAGRLALEARDHRRAASLLDLAFDLRSRLWSIRDRDRELVAIGNRIGAGVTLAGSGGAVVGVLARNEDLDAAAAAYRSAGASFLVPQVGPVVA